MSKLADHSIHAWISENNIRNEKGDPIEFRDHLFLFDIYRDRSDNIVAMMSLETVGYYSDEVGSQRYPFPFGRVLPSRGDFLAMVSNIRSARVLRSAARAFRSATPLPLVASPAPAWIPGIAWSDHWSFWQHRYPALMLTDTAIYRYPHYHLDTDTPEKLDYASMAQVFARCAGVIDAQR